MMNEGATTSFVTASGYRLHLRRLTGKRSSLPTLVFLHEGLGTIAMWGDFPDAVCQATGCPGVIYERPGYGASDPRPVPWSDNIFEQEAEIVLPALLDKLGIDRPVLIGHSDGGTIALLCAAAFPERVCGVVTLAAHVVLDELTFAGVSALERSWREGGFAQSSNGSMAPALTRCSAAGLGCGSTRQGATGRSSIGSRASPARFLRSRAPTTSTAWWPSSTRSWLASPARRSVLSSRTALTTHIIRRAPMSSSA
jgi:pimeloyl-ACP methyl ester carboxylesterase